jgi:hypothetical protein
LKLINNKIDTANSNKETRREYNLMGVELSFLKKRIGMERIIGINISKERILFIYNIRCNLFKKKIL